MKTFHTDSRKDRLIQERVHDPYKTDRKLREPSVCPVCQAVFKGGRWQWLESWPTDSRAIICQACQRIRHDYPAGIITMSGNFVTTHRTEILNLARNAEKAECYEHPLNRIIKVDDRPGRVVVSTTDTHLPRRIGAALRHAFKGELALRYEESASFVRVNWHREQ